jgi:hypothetical protein
VKKTTLSGGSTGGSTKRRSCWPTAMTVVLAVLVISGCGGEKLPRLPAYDPRWSGGCYLNEPVSTAFPVSEEKGEAEVYRLDFVKRDSAAAADIARKFGVTSDPVPDENAKGLYVAEDEDGRVLVSEYWGFSYSRKIERDERPTGEALPEAEAEKIARDFLRDYDLLPKIEVTMTTRVLESSANMEVVFGAAKMPWRGPLDWQHISVEVGPDGQVWELDYSWQEPHAIGKYPIISMAEAVKRLNACEAYVSDRGENRNVLEFTEAELAYVGMVEGTVEYDPPYDFLVPAWLFKGETIQVEGKERPWEAAWIPAVPDEYLEAASH